MLPGRRDQYLAFYQLFMDSIPWVRCASGNVFKVQWNAATNAVRACQLSGLWIIEKNHCERIMLINILHSINSSSMWWWMIIQQCRKASLYWNWWWTLRFWNRGVVQSIARFFDLENSCENLVNLVSKSHLETWGLKKISRSRLEPWDIDKKNLVLVSNFEI